MKSITKANQEYGEVAVKTVGGDKKNLKFWLCEPHSNAAGAKTKLLLFLIHFTIRICHDSIWEKE